MCRSSLAPCIASNVELNQGPYSHVLCITRDEVFAKGLQSNHRAVVFVAVSLSTEGSHCMSFKCGIVIFDTAK